MALVLLLFLLVKVLPETYFYFSFSSPTILEISPTPVFPLEKDFSVNSFKTEEYLDKDIGFLKNIVELVPAYSFQLELNCTILFLLICSGFIGFFFGISKEKIKEKEFCSKSPSSRGSTMVSAVASPNYTSEIFDFIPFSNIFSHSSFDNYIDNGSYHKNFIEQSLLWETLSEKAYLARHKLDNELYLIKCIPLTINLTDNLKDQTLFQEVSRIKNINCRHIARYVTCWIESQDIQFNSLNVDVLLYVQIEYITGMSLKEWLSCNFKPELGIRVIKQVSKVLQYLHSKSIPHGDISLENIFLDPYKNITIGDFNFQKTISDDIENFSEIVFAIINSYKQEKEVYYNQIISLDYVSKILPTHKIKDYF